jgi:hypothetical protein
VSFAVKAKYNKMKKLLLVITLILGILNGFAQDQIKPLPKLGYEKRIREYVDKMKVVDTHEHIGVFPKLWDRERISVLNVLCGYVNDDKQSAGMPMYDWEKPYF